MGDTFLLHTSREVFVADLMGRRESAGHRRRRWVVLSRCQLATSGSTQIAKDGALRRS
jgi:hypothetical protein